MNRTTVPLMTIFTPTYNRSALLGRLFDSIKKQVPPGAPVNWLIVDDGSTDGTRERVAGFIEERRDLITYVSVENGGKHRAFNLSVRHSEAPWIMSVDSDDLVADGAIEDILALLKSVDCSGSKDLGVIRGLSAFPDQPHLNRRFNADSAVSSHAEWVNSKSAFDTTVVFRRELLTMYPFSEFEGEQFQAESLLWHRVDATHETRFVNHIWCHCYYQADGLSSNSAKLRAKSPRSAMAVYAATFDSRLLYRLRAKAAINWWRYHFHAKNSGSARVSGRRMPLIYGPFGRVMFFLDCFLSSPTTRDMVHQAKRVEL